MLSVAVLVKTERVPLSFTLEYRKYELGTARNDNGYKFNFTLANIGSAGNLRHSDQVF